MNQFRHTQIIKDLALQHGFDFCGIAEAKELTEDAFRLEQWLAKGFHGEMQYMEKHFDLRINPKKLVPGAKSVITFLKNYYPEQVQEDGFPKIAKYAYGQDYHFVIKDKLKELITLSKSLLKLPNDYKVGIVAGSDTGAIEMAMWSLLGATGVDILGWENFGNDWVKDAVSQLKIKNLNLHKADYGKLPDLTKVDFDKITHLNIAFINPDPKSATFVEMPALNTVVKTAHQKGVYVMLSCGGGSPQRYYTDLLRNKRPALVKNFIDFVDKYKLDGVDVDLEGNDIDANYENFITELRTPLTERKKLLTSAVAWWTRARVTDRALKAFDFISIMAYDATGRWDLTKPGQHSTYAYAAQHLNYWHGQRGLEKKKLVLGVPFYGYGFGALFDNNASLAQMSWQTVQQNNPDWMNADEISYPNNCGTF